MDGCQEALGNGDYAGAIRLLLDWNKAVMETRGAAPWVRLGDRRRLDVRYRGNEPRLPDGALLHESSRARTMPTDRVLTCRFDMTLVGRARSSD